MGAMKRLLLDLAEEKAEDVCRAARPRRAAALNAIRRKVQR